jgi:hypothetical protein
MIRMREPMRGHASLGGMSTDVAASTHLRAPILMPSGSIARRAPLESSQVRHALFDIGAVLLAFLFVTITGFALALGLFILLFVQT